MIVASITPAGQVLPAVADSIMVERYRRGKGKQPLLGSHQRCWIWGRNVVLETLRAGRWPMYELFLADRIADDAADEIRTLAESHGVPVHIETADDLRRRCHSGEHQGYLARMPPFPYADAEQLLADRPQCPLYVVLDGVQDPFNFGAILRSADVLGVDAVFIASAGQVGVTSLVARTSAGAVNHVPIARVDDLPDLLRRMRKLHIDSVAATERGTTPLDRHDFRRPTALVIGNEGRGIREDVLRECTAHVTIPQAGRVAALNAAVSAGILFYEAARQRNAK
jgi:23S rRNA (guanosine2251-2'-O)-methyltransferase